MSSHDITLFHVNFVTFYYFTNSFIHTFNKHLLSNHYTWTSPDGQYQNETDYIACSQRWRSSRESAKTRPEADCGSDHELLITNFRLKLKKVGKTTRPFKYELSQIPYDYTVEVTYGFKGSGLIERMPEELWTEVYDIL